MIIQCRTMTIKCTGFALVTRGLKLIIARRQRLDEATAAWPGDRSGGLSPSFLLYFGLVFIKTLHLQVKIPGNWYIDDLPPMMFIKRRPAVTDGSIRGTLRIFRRITLTISIVNMVSLFSL